MVFPFHATASHDTPWVGSGLRPHAQSTLVETQLETRLGEKQTIDLKLQNITLLTLNK